MRLALELMHVVVTLAPFAHADRLTQLVQPHDLARLAVPPHVVDLAVSLGQRGPQNRF